MFSFNSRLKKILSPFVPNIYIQSRLLHCVCLFTARISIFYNKVRLSKSSENTAKLAFFLSNVTLSFSTVDLLKAENIFNWRLQKGAMSKSQRELVTLLFAFKSLTQLLDPFWENLIHRVDLGSFWENLLHKPLWSDLFCLHSAALVLESANCIIFSCPRSFRARPSRMSNDH